VVAGSCLTFWLLVVVGSCRLLLLRINRGSDDCGSECCQPANATS